MHVRIRQRRESVDARALAGADAVDFARALRLMTAIESRIIAISAACDDARLPALMAAIKSASMILEMSARSSETAKRLMPCANAALLHVRSEMMLIGLELRGRAKQEFDLATPCLAPMAPGAPA